MAISKRAVGIGAGTLVVGTAVSAALINELHGGWPWWVATAIVVLVCAVLTGKLAAYTAAEPAQELPSGGQVNIASGDMYVVQNGNQTIGTRGR